MSKNKRDNVYFIHPSLGSMNVNDLWFQGLERFCTNISNHYTAITKKRLTMAEIDQFTDAMKIILCEQNDVPTEKENGVE